jgi:hypothetical protein
MLTQTAPAELPVGHLGLVRCASGSPLTVKQGADQDAVALEQMISVLPFKIATARASEHRGGLYVGRVARDQKHRLHRSRGTEGSNPSPSSGESAANLTLSIRGAPVPQIGIRTCVDAPASRPT